MDLAAAMCELLKSNLFPPVLFSVSHVCCLGYRELSFVQALLAASLVATYTRTCARGKLGDCASCQDLHKMHVEEYLESVDKRNTSAAAQRNYNKWAHYSCDNIRPALSFAKHFADGLEETESANRRISRSAKMAVANYAIGRKVCKNLSGKSNNRSVVMMRSCHQTLSLHNHMWTVCPDSEQCEMQATRLIELALLKWKH